ncbi:MAG TPA: AlkA N-terminal domain-containing protein [Acidimicrobiales bacterium]|nr:AlkA N-terminal domain-containing protein [Acidimicrobiales bacterium]
MHAVAVMDEEHCYRAACSKDGRFDGAFFTAVITTGIYCRPSCPAMTPKRANVRFYPTAAAAQEAGFRACKRCRPDASPGSPEWLGRADVVARAVRLIGDGVVEREGISGLARRLGYSTRQLHRLVFAELGTGPLSLARARRVQHARMLLETTELPVTEVAFASGFGSIRHFNDSIRDVYALSPTEIRLRGARHRRPRALAGQGIEVHLAYRPPIDLDDLLGFLGQRAVPGVENWDGRTYSRVLALPHGEGFVSVSAGDGDPQPPASYAKRRSRSGYVCCMVELQDTRDFTTAVARVRSQLDLDADPIAVSAILGRDATMEPLVEARPGLRVPGSVDGWETAFRAVIGQQVSVGGARTLAGRLSQSFGKAAQQPRDGLTHMFPTADAIAAADPAALPLPATRAHALVTLARAVAEGRIVIDPGADRDETEAALKALPGIGQWTASYVRMRALGDPDVFLAGDLGVQRGLQRASGGDDVGADGRSALAASEAWRPWRSYATVHLWSANPAGQLSRKEIVLS